MTISRFKMKGAIINVCVSIILISIFTSNRMICKADNVDDVLSNKRLLQNYVNCLLDKGKCGPQAQEIKSKYCDYYY